MDLDWDGLASQDGKPNEIHEAADTAASLTISRMQRLLEPPMFLDGATVDDLCDIVQLARRITKRCDELTDAAETQIQTLQQAGVNPKRHTVTVVDRWRMSWDDNALMELQQGMPPGSPVADAIKHSLTISKADFERMSDDDRALVAHALTMKQIKPTITIEDK